MEQISLFRKLWKNRFFLHVLFWIGILMVFGIPYMTLEGDRLTMLYDLLILLPVKMVAAYFTIYFLLPKFLLKKQYLNFFLLLFFSAAVFGLINRLLQFYIISPLYYPETYMGLHFWKPSHLLYGIISIYTVVAIATAIKLLKQFYDNQKLQEQLNKEKLEAELNLLKAQIHPHFLFNTLNNLYGLALANSEKTAEGILKLSGLLDYMLYECNVPKISLDKEIKLISDYLALERLRYGKRLKVEFNQNGNTMGKQIAPMLILPFVENSFKHGSSKKTKQVNISINLNVVNHRMILDVENSKPAHESSDPSGYTEGIGLKNVKKRLELLYNSQYILDINENELNFNIHLELELL